jgi:hypothetical protein
MASDNKYLHMSRMLAYNTTKLMTFYASGTHIKTDEWVEGFFSVSNGGIFTVAFETYGDIYYLKPSVVAIDDVSFQTLFGRLN